MATENMNIKVTFQNAAKRGLQNLNSDLGKIGKGAQKSAKGLNNMYTQLAGVASLLAGGALFGNAIKTFADFDDNMRAAGAVTSATAEELEHMTEVAKKMGAETRYTASNAAEALRFLGMAGFEAAEAAEALPGVLNLAAAGALELGDAADIATNVLSAFGLEVGNLERVNDVLAKTFTSSNTNLIEIGESFKYVGSLSKGVGGDFEDLLATIGKLGDAGQKGSLAGTNLKNAIGALLAPTAKEAEAMAKLGARIGQTTLRVKDSEGDFIGFVEVIKQLEAAGLSGDEALAAFGERAGPALQALVNQGSQGLEDLIKELRAAGGTSKEIADQMEAGLGGQLRKTASVIESFKIQLGEAFGPEVTIVLSTFRDWIRAITDAVKQMQENGNLQGWGEGVIEIFDFMITGLTRIYNGLSAISSLAIAAGGLITGQFDLAKAAMDGFVKDINNLYGTAEDPLAESGGKVVRAITKEMRSELEKSVEDTGPIGKGTKKVGDKIVKNIVPAASIESILKASLIKINAALATESAKLEADYENKLISLSDYYDRRLSIVAQKIEAERKILEQQLAASNDPDKKAALNAKLFALDQAYQTEKIKLAQEAKTDQDKLDADLLKSKEKLNKLKLNADKALQDQQQRLRVEGQTAIEADFQKEISDLQNKQNQEMQIVKKFHEEQLQALRDRKASEAEIEAATQAEKDAIAEQSRLQTLEKEQQAADQALKLQEYRLNNFKTIAQGTADVFTKLYQMTGEKNKELFYIAKAAALAEATINIAAAITKALPNIPLAIATGAMGAVQLATIASTGLADGGEVPGYSPHAKADNIGIMATAGEFMQPVSAVDYYGKGVMEAIRRKSIPRGAFAGYATGGLIAKGRQNRFADGGLVSSGAQMPGQRGNGSTEITMINVSDPRELDQYLSSASGQNAVLNVINSKSEAVKRILRS